MIEALECKEDFYTFWEYFFDWRDKFCGGVEGDLGIAFDTALTIVESRIDFSDIYFKNYLKRAENLLKFYIEKPTDEGSGLFEDALKEIRNYKAETSLAKQVILENMALSWRQLSAETTVNFTFYNHLVSIFEKFSHDFARVTFHTAMKSGLKVR